jgi:hypothetical protein
MKIMDKFRIEDSNNITNKKGIRGLIKVKNAKTGEYVAIREGRYHDKDNLIVTTGKTHTRDLLSTETISADINFLGYFKVGEVNLASPGLEATTSDMDDLQNPIELGYVYRNDTVTHTEFDVTLGTGELDYASPSGDYSSESYLLDESDNVIGKKPDTIDTSSDDAVMYKLVITPNDFNTSRKINELGLFILNRSLSDFSGITDLASFNNVVADETNLTYTYPSDTETMFSRVTFDAVPMDGSTEYIIEYYIYF